MSIRFARQENDIKAPDGFLLGGLRKVRLDGTILFQRGFWRAPKAWIGHMVWVHTTDDGGVEAAPPGFHIYDKANGVKTVFCKRTKRRDAKPGYRRPDHKAWAARMAGE